MSAVTIKDVAQLAGVSPSTVSRVISNHPKISPATRKKVRDAMHQLDYHPNIMAKSLVSKNTNTIGLVLPYSSDNLFINPFFSEVLRGMLAYANNKNYDLLLSSARNQREELEAINRMVLGKRIDGVVLMSPSRDDVIVKKLMEYDFPFVLLGRSLEYPDVLSVNNDNIKASFDLTNYLIAQGHQKIGIVTGKPELVVSEDRLSGFQRALRQAGLPLNPDWIVSAEMLEKNAYHTISMLMNAGDRPTAILVIDDVIAISLIRELAEIGFGVPEDISIVGFNNIYMSEMSNPPLTTIDVGIYQLGYQTIQQLIRKLAGEDHPSKVTVPHRLVVRESTK
ncbi:LacI family transcriptional regulator [Shimazuella sp. AN120528]|uniref:LacI family DNA-binding transcriptional regulator n=1 Tax=Shimazuella soli TaxID=1892854 RepID=UPI001F0D8A65|nr:LacI family DNA-binding transcriptional regulator [Shimazuella soli]MCH5584552.1 LacI family transcriptional regulator [Shimazuella soli]